ncbi:unnamed protein product [Sphagnum tenellum]
MENDLRKWMRLVESTEHEIISESVHQDKSLPEVKAEIEANLNDDDLPENERELLLQQHGVIDDLIFDEHGNLTIYRSMWVTPTWIKRAKPGQRLGIYWSHDPNTASPYNAETSGEDGHHAAL